MSDSQEPLEAGTGLDLQAVALSPCAHTAPFLDTDVFLCLKLTFVVSGQLDILAFEVSPDLPFRADSQYGGGNNIAFKIHIDLAIALREDFTLGADFP